MPTVPAVRRLSPKVRRLLEEHDLQARSVAGTGADGRVTPPDVRGAAGVPRRPLGGGVLASPLARRRLREAGVDLAAAAGATEELCLTRTKAERLIAELTDEPDGAPDTQRHRGRQASDEQVAAATTDVEVDVARLLASMAVANPGFLSYSGFELSAEVALASAAAAVLVRRPELAVAAILEPPSDGRTYPTFHVGFPRPGASGGDVAVVPDAQYLTVAGLARRARAALARTDEVVTQPTHVPSVVVATDGGAPRGLGGTAAIGLLTISTTTPRRVASTDDLGNEVVRSRPHARVRLHHDERTTTTAAAEAFLEELRTAVTAWSLPLGP